MQVTVGGSLYLAMLGAIVVLFVAVLWRSAGFAKGVGCVGKEPRKLAEYLKVGIGYRFLSGTPVDNDKNQILLIQIGRQRERRVFYVIGVERPPNDFALIDGAVKAYDEPSLQPPEPPLKPPYGRQ